MLLTALKLAIWQVIKSWINEDEKNAAELWSILETEYRMHAADVWLNLIRKFTTISMNSYNKNVQAYISNFRDICGKLKNMKLNIPIWIKNDKFTNSLQSHQGEFVQMKWDKIQDFKKKITIKNSKLTFKLERSSNYDTWRNEALAQALAIEAKSILKNKKLICPDEMTDDDAQIWEIKRKVSFNMLLTALKSAIQQVIKS